MIFELCAESLEACRAACVGGAHRIELCTSLEVGGLTPDAALVAAAVEGSSLPVHVLLRPTAATFQSSPEILRAMRASMLEGKRAGVAGFVLGFLDAQGRVDVSHTRALVDVASPLPVTFHRAFDETANLEQALEDVITTGCTRVLTSGGAADVLSGAPMLCRLVRLAGERIAVAAGGGLRSTNARQIAQTTGCKQYHGSLRETGDGTTAPWAELAGRVRVVVEILAAALDTVSLVHGKEVS